MKTLLRSSLVVLALATTGLFAQTAPTTGSGSTVPTKTAKTEKKAHKKQAKHKKKHKKHAKKS